MSFSISGRRFRRVPALVLVPALVALVAGELLAGPAHPVARLAPASTVTNASPAGTPKLDSTAHTARPNIVEVLADDMRVDDLQYAPNLRRLVAAQGITMQNSFSSYPLCCPARASFFTGELPHNHGVYTTTAPYGYRAFDDRHTIATAAKAAGYRTGLVGKYLNGYGSDVALAPRLRWQARHPHASPRRAPRVQSQYYVPRGWDDWKAAIAGVACRPACGGAYNYFHYAFSNNGHPTAARSGAYSSTVIGTQAVAMAKRFHRNRARTSHPFLMSVNYIAPHYGRGQGRLRAKNPDGSTTTLMTPAAPKWAYRATAVRHVSKGAGITIGGVGEPDVSDKPGRFADLRPLTAAERAIETESTRRRAAAVYAMDRSIGRLIRQLKASGEWGRTVFVFWSDNGYFQGEHNRMSGKTHVYEPSLRVPMLITGPGMRGGSHDGLYGGQDRFAPIDVVDLTHTLLDITGATPPHTPDGKSMVPVLRGQDTGWTEAVPYEAVGNNPARAEAIENDRELSPATGTARTAGGDPRDSVGVRTGRWVYVHYVDGEDEIYDLWNDPLQWSNLASSPAWLAQNQDVVSALQSAWRQVRGCVGDTCHPQLSSTVTVTSAKNAAATTDYWHQIAAEYGWSSVLRR